jgi:hypothetical protein
VFKRKRDVANHHVVQLLHDFENHLVSVAHAGVHYVKDHVDWFKLEVNRFVLRRSHQFFEALAAALKQLTQ